MIRRRPGVTLVAVLTLALGIGANTAVFTVVNAVLLRPLPYASSDRLVFVSLDLNTGFGERTSLPMADFLAWRASNRACEKVVVYTESDSVAVSGPGDTEAVVATAATAQFFDALGVTAGVGRVWHEGDDRPGAPATVVVSHRYWDQRLHADPNAIGRTLGIDGRPFTIIGVAPPGFAFPSADGQLWTILAVTPPTRRGPFFLRGLGLLKVGATATHVRADLANADQQVRQQFPRRNPANYRVEFLKDVVTGDARPALLLLLAAVGVVLLVAIVNVANLFLASAAERQGEIAVRVALGAARGRIARQLVTEGLLVALVAAAAGGVVAIWATRVLVAMVPSNLPRGAEIHMDLRVFGFALLIALVSATLFAAVSTLAPARHFSAHTFAENVQAGARSAGRPATGRLRHVLVVSEIALALMLAVAASLLAKSLRRLERVEVGFSPDHVVTAAITVPQSRYPDRPRVIGLFDDLLARIDALPGVIGASFTNSLPPDGLSVTDGFVVENRLPPPDRGAPVGPFLSVSDDYFRVLRVRRLTGRWFGPEDSSVSTRVAIVSASLVRRHFGDLDPIGRRVKQVGDWPKPDDNPWLTVVGVVDDVKYAGLAEETGPALYVPLRQNPFRSQNLVVRADGDPGSTVTAIREALHGIDPDLPLANVRMMDERLWTAASPHRFRARLMGLFGVMGLVLAAIGIYGVLSYAVAQRTREIGIRAALGATEMELVRLVLRESLALTAVGAAIGLALSLAAGRLLTAVLFAVSPTDIVAIAGATALLVSVAIVSALLPARRAAAVDPATALRAN
jgi:putative ABC transport system permease protein